MATFEIDSEEQAWELLQEALEGRLDLREAPTFNFDKWPIIDIHLPATPVESSISPTMMEAFIELQKSINRAYTLTSADTGDLRYLTNAERERLEIRVVVTKGSSEYAAKLADALEKIGLEAVGKMDPHNLMITIIGVALVVGGVIVFRSWMAHKTEVRKAEIDSVEKAKFLDAQIATLTQGTENMKILAQAYERSPLLADIDAATEPARAQMVKSVGDEGGGRLYGTDLGTELASEITAQRRRAGEQIRLAGNYRVVRVDTTSPDGFRVTLADDQNNREITATMQDALLSEQHKKAIRDAEWAKRPVYVELTARELRNRLVDAVVLNASEAKEKTL